jgi:fused signal recognition particle receptor
VTHDLFPLVLVGLSFGTGGVALACFLIGFTRPSASPLVSREGAKLAAALAEASPVPAQRASAPSVSPAPQPRDSTPVAERPSPAKAAAAEPRKAPGAPPRPTRTPAPADWFSGLRKTRDALLGRLDAVLGGAERIDPALLDEIEAVLLSADLGTRTADDLLEVARRSRSAAEVRPALRARALEILAPVEREPLGIAAKPHIVLVVGVNGSGKTTTIGKLADRYQREGRRVLVAAADTYRAAAIEQLEVWAARAEADIIKGEPGSDPAAVAFDAVKFARGHGLDVVLIDTAGRLQTDVGLMDQLRKMVRVVKKEIPDAPHEVLLVLDANIGQNAIRQAQQFKVAVDVSGIALTKLDGTAKGGVVLGVAQELALPVRYVGIGEGIDDLADFDAEQFVEALFARASGPRTAAPSPTVH